jgi:predicted pyridoxine 5'-phosphate oxidase superfamily flavin-nucleotide-binding protein
MSAFHEGELAVQRRAGVERNAERIGHSIHGEIPELARRFAVEREFLLLGAADAAGRVWATLLRGPRGFVTVPADDVLRVAALPGPEDPLAATLAGPAEVGTLLIDPATRRRMRLNGRARPDGAGGLEITAREVYANCPKYIHPRAVHLPGAAPSRAARSDRLSPDQVAWLSATDTLFLATRHPDAGADVSHRGGERGFVKVPAADRLLIPDYAGNMMFNTLGNVAADGRAGLLLVDFETGRTLQLTGSARIQWDPAVVRALPGAERVLEVEVEGVVEAVPARGLISAGAP